MRKRLAVGIAVLLALSICAVPAAAFEGGGRKPSEAAPIAFGQHYPGQLNNHASDANFGSSTEVAFWHLPPLSTHDSIVVNWHVLPYTATYRSGEFPVCMILAQGLDDFNWGGIFEDRDSCHESGSTTYSVSRSGTAQTSITVQDTNATSSYLEFYAGGGETEASDFETYPYDFTVEAPRHYLGIAFSPVKEVSASGSLTANVTTADGSAAPDGLAFNLAGTWSGGGVASYTATTSGGKLTFTLALPETAAGKTVNFAASRPADAQYQAVTSAKLSVEVAKATPPPPSPCALARRHLRAVGREYLRISRHADRARGPSRRRLLNRKRRVKRNLRAARTEADTACRSR
jgi:hypothetical protein